MTRLAGKSECPPTSRGIVGSTVAWVSPVSGVASVVPNHDAAFLPLPPALDLGAPLAAPGAGRVTNNALSSAEAV